MGISATGLASLASLLAAQAPTSASPQDAGLNRRTELTLQSAQANLQNELAKAAAKKAEKKRKKGQFKQLAGTLAGAALGTLLPGVGNVVGASIGAKLGGSVASVFSGGDINVGKTVSGTLGKLAAKMVENPVSVPGPPPTSTPPLSIKGKNMNPGDFLSALNIEGKFRNQPNLTGKTRTVDDFLIVPGQQRPLSLNRPFGG